MTKYLGIDYGEKRVGISVTDENKKYSFSRDFINNDSKFYFNLLKIIREENISKIILGYPLNMSSEKTVQTLKVEDFKNKLEEFLKKNLLEAEIIFFDERFTSSIAESFIKTSGRKKTDRQVKGLVDSGSAQIILQDYIDKTNNSLNNN
ncbi:MAG: Holliday junction resolvase RuvX [bacterium]